MAAVAEHSSGWVRPTLGFFDRLLPRAWRLPRVAAAFFILRPFDALPSLWSRVLGWIFVRSRHRWAAPR